MVLGLFLAMAAPARGQITTDGTVGPALSLTGPDFEIGADLGAIAGTNLFHSFGVFNLGSGESATFSGPDTIANIIGRVTGGGGSVIDGLLRSTIDGPDLSLNHPSGVILWATARPDLKG